MSGQQELRASIITGLAGLGMPRDEAGRIADVALHAVDEAVKTLERITDTLQGREWTNAYSIALQALGAIADERQAALMETAKELMPESGIKTFKVSGSL